MGGLSLTRENALVFIVVVAAWALWRFEWRRSLVALRGGPRHRPASPSRRETRPSAAASTSRPRSSAPTSTSATIPRPTAPTRRFASAAARRSSSGRTPPRWPQQALNRTLSPAEVSSYWTEPRAVVHHDAAGRLGRAHGPQGRPARQRLGDARHGEPGELRRVVAAPPPRRGDRALRRPRAAGALRRHRHLAGSPAARGASS